MVIRAILAAIAVAAVATRPRSRWSAVVALAAGGASALAAGSWVVSDACRAVGPMLLVLCAALTVAGLAERAGVADRGAAALSRAAGGDVVRLYLLVCATSVLLTGIVTLDGAVVLLVPLVQALSRRRPIPVSPFLAGTVAVANAASLAVPEGNPTNLVVMSRLGVSASGFLTHLLVPGIVAAWLCALVPLRQVRGASASSEVPHPPALILPWRIGAQMTGLLAVLDGLLPTLSLRGGRLPELLAVAAATAAAAALANNLPVTASVAALATGGPGVYAALIGLSVGALATAHGSVATLIARDLADDRGPWARAWAPVAAAAVALATVVLWILS
jgi:Na+/H+ antiporter NhaD/arsenite permease-like protein